MTGELNHDLRNLEAPLPSNVQIVIRLTKACDKKILMVNQNDADGNLDPIKAAVKYRMVIKYIEMHVKRQCLNVEMRQKVDTLIKEKPLRYFYDRLQVFEQLGMLH